MNAIRKAALLVAAAATLPLGAARAANDWTYYAANAAGNPTNVACIVKGDWIVEVDIMTLNKGMFSPKHILASASDGILDFRDLHIDGTAITNLNIRQGNLWQDANVVEFYANHVTAFGEIFGRSTANSRIVHLASDTMTTIGSRFASLTNLVFDYPNATTWSAQFHNCSLTNDVSEIIPPSIQKFTVSSGGLGAGVTGELVLTNFCEAPTTVSGGLFPAGVSSAKIKFTGTDFSGQMFRLASPNALRDVELIATNATAMNLTYVMNTGVTNMVLDIPNVANANNSVLPIPASAPSSVWFYNAPNDPSVVTQLFSSVTAVPSNRNQDKYCTIYCSRRQGWGELASPLEGDYERALAPEGCFGVLVTKKGRAAWMVKRTSPHEPKGTVICIR